MGVSIREYARRRGVHMEAVRKALRTNRIQAEPDGSIDPDRADRDWAKNTSVSSAAPSIATTRAIASNDFVGEVSNPTQKSNDPIQAYLKARAAEKVVDAKRAALELRIREGELVEISPVNAWVSGMIVRCRDIFMNLGPELRDRLAQEIDPIRCQALIDAEVRRGLQELSEYRPHA